MAVQALLQLASSQDLSALDRVFEHLAKKTIALLSQSVDEHDDFHRGIEIPEIENSLGNVD